MTLEEIMRALHHSGCVTQCVRVEVRRASQGFASGSFTFEFFTTERDATQAREILEIKSIEHPKTLNLPNTRP